MSIISPSRLRVREVLQTDVVRSLALAGGCIGDVRRLTLKDGREVVAKIGKGQSPGLAVEGFMLSYLKANTALPVPAVLFADDSLLLMEHIASRGGINAAVEENAAEHLAALHNMSADHFGFARDTLIGGLPQPNARTRSWIAFFRDQRLLYMAREAFVGGRLPAPLFMRVEKLCARLDTWLQEPSAPSLIHGDVWTGNVLPYDDHVAAFIDPALYFADAEIELAFATLFGTFGEAFFRRYGELRPLRPGFFEERRDLYNLYPLLVHVRLFGGSYVADVDRTLKRFGV